MCKENVVGPVYKIKCEGCDAASQWTIFLVNVATIFIVYGPTLC